MKKTTLMLAGFTVLFSLAAACFTPSSKKDKSSTVNEDTTEEVKDSASEN